MKPIYVKMSAFGSYAGEEIIDFTDVNHGIFLITGDTGAGKTTIFDAITYALYDETSGGKRDGEMMRSQYAQEDTRTYVEFKFTYNGETYIITRFPKQNRISRKKNKDGEYTMTVDQPSAELIMPDGLPFKGKIKETNQKIIDIIGLDINQFTQIAMIAQGDFLKLLHAPSKERKEIFAKIFNTRIYWRMEDELRNLAKSMYGKLEDNRKDIIREMENVKCIEGSAFDIQWAELPHFLESDPDKQINLVRQITEEARDKEEVINKAIRLNQEELDLVTADINQANDTNKLFTSLEKAQKNKVELDGRKVEMEGIKLKIEAAKKALLVEPKEAAFLVKQKELEECSYRIAVIKEWLENNKETLVKLKLSKDESEAEYKKQNPVLSLRISKIGELLPKYELFEKKNSGIKELAQKKITVKAGLDVIIENIGKAKDRQEKLIVDQEKLKTVAEGAALYKQSVEKMAEKKEALENLLSLIQALHKLNDAFISAEKEFKTAEEDVHEKINQYDTLYQHFIEGQAGLLAHELMEGCPCPVCGSTSHPQKAAITDTSITQNELQTAKKVKDYAEKALKEKSEALQQAKQNYENKKTLADHEGRKIVSSDFNVETVIEEELKNVLKESNNQLIMETDKKKQAEAAKQKYDNNEVELKRLKGDLDTYADTKEGTDKILNELEINYAAAASELMTLKTSLIYENKEAAEGELSASKELMTGLDTAMTKAADNYQALLNITTGKQGNLKTEEIGLARLSEDVKRTEDDFIQEIIRQGFTDKEGYHSALLTTIEIVESEKYFQEYRDDVIKNNESLKNYIEQTAGKYRILTDTMEERKAGLVQSKSQLNEVNKSVYGIRSRNEMVIEKTAKLMEIRKATKEQYTIISRLDATANGKLSQRHMNFQTYIQRRYFNSILKEANKRLYVMSNSQFILKCRDVGDLSGQGEVGLDLDVYSMVNDQTRDVKTLSGGESFMAALAMALGMADIIQNTAGSIHIDTMFIDEGFGSLSDDTRIQAINILNELSGGKRLVGIISHVTELKAQIGTKLLVTKGERGSKVKWDIGE